MSAGLANAMIAMPISMVTPATLTITADDKTKFVGESNPVLTVTYNGFVNNEDASKLIFQPIITTTALTASPPGQYPIVASSATSVNYSIVYVAGTLSIINPTIIVIPNTFTPNGDGINDTWEIKNLNFYPNCSVGIYNRYGESLYSSIGYGIPWDGKFRGAILPSGTYYYIINLKNGFKPLSGSITIIR